MKDKQERQDHAIQAKTIHDNTKQCYTISRQHMTRQNNNKNKTIPTQIEDNTRQAKTRPYQINATRQDNTI